MRVAVVISNLGGPSSLSEVRPFLKALFSDPRMLPYPKLVRWFLANFISLVRANKSRRMYKAIGGKSPLIDATNAQARSLEYKLNSRKGPSNHEFRVFVYMRYTGPSAEDIFRDIQEYNPDKLVLLPLYPHLSYATTLSMFDAWNRALNGSSLRHVRICCFYNDQIFLRAQSRAIRTAYDFASSKKAKVRILFSAHSIPQSFVDMGDVYEMQIMANARKISEILAIPGLDWRVSYQSRIGAAKWLGPSTSSEIIAAGQEKCFIILVPISFVSDNLEVTYEMDLVYKQLAINSGAAGCFRVGTLGTDELFIESLARQVEYAAEKEGAVSSCDVMSCGQLCLR